MASGIGLSLSLACVDDDDEDELSLETVWFSWTGGKAGALNGRPRAYLVT